MPGKRALLVVSNGKSSALNGSLARTEAELAAAGVTWSVYNGIQQNPTKAVIEAGAEKAREEGADFIVAVGGGSVLDSGKIIAMLAPQPSANLWTYSFSPNGGKMTPPRPVLPWIAVTTSAGTGSEVDDDGVVTNPETMEKVSVGAFPGMMAVYAIVDPDFTKTVPPHLTAYQGFDALFHSVEGYVGRRHNLMGDMVQRTAIEKIGKYLPRAVKDGNDMEAREAVSLANTLSGYSMDLCGCNSEHSMEHAMSAFHPDLPHGAGLIMIAAEYYYFWIEKHLCDQRFVDMAVFLGMREAADPHDFVKALVSLERACGVDELKMSDYGITREELPELVKNSREKMGKLYPRDPGDATDEEILDIFEKAYR